MRLFGSAGNGATVAINMRPKRAPWGGGNQFVEQLAGMLRRLGFAVRFDLRVEPDCIVLIDPRIELEAVTFGPREVAAQRARNSKVCVLHRINECDQRKSSGFMDTMLAEANLLADVTVFISEWLREYHSSRWFDTARLHAVIYNGADRRHFHPLGNSAPRHGEPVRVVTHHWSANMMKGFDVYAEVDRLIAEGELPGFELWVIGRWPAEVQWRAARTFAPVRGERLGALLRQCHLYLTASRWEPCGMHHIEGAQCGLPLVFHEDGGGIVEAGRRYGVGYREDVAAALRDARDRHAELRARLLSQLPSGDRMASEFADLILRLIAERA